MLETALFILFIVACLLIAFGVGFIFWPAGLITAGVLLMTTVLKLASAEPGVNN